MPDDIAASALDNRRANPTPDREMDDWGAARRGFSIKDITPGLDIRRIVATFRRRLKLFAAIYMLVFVAVFVWTARATPEYTATANVMLDTRAQRVVESEAVLSGLPPDSATVDTEVEILRSRQLAERVVSALNLEKDPEFNPSLRKPSGLQAIKKGVKDLFRQAPEKPRQPTAMDAQLLRQQVVDTMLGRLQVRRVGLTYVMDVSFTSKDPAKAALVANTLADKYLLEQLEAKFDATRQASAWLNSRLESLRGEVLRNEAAVASYKAANNLLSASGATLTEQEISTYNQGLAAAQAELAEKRARLNAAQRQLSAGSTGDDVSEALGSAVVQSLRAQRAVVSGRVADLEGRYGPRHPEMLKAQRELDDIDAQIQAEIRRLVSNLRAEVDVAEQRTASLQSSVGTARTALASNNAAGVRLNELERNAESARTLYESYLNRFKQTSSQEGLSQSDGRVVSRAKIPTAQSSPNVKLNLAMGFFAAVALSVLAVILAEAWDVGLSTAEDVEQKLGLPYLGMVPQLSSVAPEAKSRWPFDYIAENPLSAFGELVRSLRTSILSTGGAAPPKIITITSALPSEGKTTASICLARVSAQMGQRTVLLDCDVRRRNINRAVGFEPSVGLLELLAGTATIEQVLVREESTGLSFLPLAATAFGPKDVFGGESMDKLLKELATKFDLIIMDAPPVLAVSEARVLALKSDAVVFLLRWRVTPLNAVRAALKLLAGAGGKVIGVGLTQVDMRQQVTQGYGDPGYYYEQYKSYYG